MKSSLLFFNRIKGVLLALISSGTFGLIPLFTIPLRQEENMNEVSIVFYRYLLSAFLILVLCLFDRKSLRVSSRSLLRLILISVFYATTTISLVYAYNYIPSGVVTTIHFLYPVVVVFLMTLIYREALSRRLLFIALMAIVGVGFLAFSGGGESDYLHNHSVGVIIGGLFLALSTAFTYGFYIVGLNLGGVRELDSKVVSFYVLLMGSLFYALYAQFTSGIQWVPSGKAWMNLSLLALFPTVISLITLVLAVKSIGSSTTSILGAAEPIIAVFCGVWVFNEAFTINSLIGLVLVIMAVTLVMLDAAKRKAAKREEVRGD